MTRPLMMRWMFALFCSLTAIVSFAQTKPIGGLVTDSIGTPLSQATVNVRNGKASAVTNFNWVFTTAVPADAQYLTVGMTSQDIAIGNHTQIAVKLQAGNSSLNEVVVGYGTSCRANVNSSIASVKESDIKNLVVAGMLPVLISVSHLPMEQMRLPILFVPAHRMNLKPCGISPLITSRQKKSAQSLVRV